MKTKLQKLQGVRDRLEDPERWELGALATNDQGEEVDPDDDDAVRWCLVGAVSLTGETCESLLDMNWEDAADLNNYGGHPAVIALLDSRIAALSSTS